jgi:hypothetical protein
VGRLQSSHLRVIIFKSETIKKNTNISQAKKVIIAKKSYDREKQISSIIKIENLDDELISDIKEIPCKSSIDKLYIFEKYWSIISQ